MVHKIRSLRSDMELNANQGHAKGGAFNSTNAGIHPPRPVRQFSTRSRAKSTASFKGLHRIVANDCVGDNEDDTLGNGGFKKSRSSDSLCRKRALSGLNMTALGRVKSHPIQPSIWRSGSDTSANSFSMQTMGGIKPSRNKSTHSVVDMRDGNEIYDNDSTTDEEVEYFTDEEEENEEMNGNRNDNNNKCSTDDKDENGNVKIDSNMRHQLSLHGQINGSLSDMESSGAVPKKNSHGIDQPSYKVPSNIIKQKPACDKFRSQDYSDYQNCSDNIRLNMEDDDDKISNEQRTGRFEGYVAEEDGEDHISHPDINAFNSTSGIEGINNSLTRQVNNHDETKAERIYENNYNRENSNPNIIIKNSFEISKAPSNNEDYVPDMILSQSTGVERKFEQPPTIQNSFSDDYQINSIVNNGSKIPEFDNDNNDTMKLADESSESSNHSQRQFSREMKHNTQQHTTSSISGLTTSLQGAGTGNFHGSTRMENFLQKRASQNSALRSDLRSLLSSEKQPPTLARDHSASSNVNNFGQFLKSDGIDGDSRTQRKLWLQRENSIMDLSSHSEGNDPIFMASNVEIKREFERISHEYTNIRRFTNPIEESLTRIDNNQTAVGIKGSKKTTSDVSEVAFPNYVSKNTRYDDFLPQAENAKLHRVLSGIWKEESALFNKSMNPLDKQKNNSTSHMFFQPNRNLRNTLGVGSGSHQRLVNSLQPNTRAVHRRMENNIHNQQRA